MHKRDLKPQNKYLNKFDNFRIRLKVRYEHSKIFMFFYNKFMIVYKYFFK